MSIECCRALTFVISVLVLAFPFFVAEDMGRGIFKLSKVKVATCTPIAVMGFVGYYFMI